MKGARAARQLPRVHGDGQRPAGRRRARADRAGDGGRERHREMQRSLRKNIVEMLFVEGNHFCMFCEKSGNCELQAMAYRFGITAPRTRTCSRSATSTRRTRTSMIDRNRCILCGRCVRASRDVDGKNVFEFVGRGPEKRWRSTPRRGWRHEPDVTDRGGGRLPGRRDLKKRVGYAVPVGQRQVRPRADRFGHRSATSATAKGKERTDGETEGCDDVAGRLLRLPHVAARHRRAHPEAGELVDFDKSPIDDIKEFTGAARSA
jgi:NAD-dependent dihydropyrimidine dehydrogenase PreA subunit